MFGISKKNVFFKKYIYLVFLKLFLYGIIVTNLNYKTDKNVRKL